MKIEEYKYTRKCTYINADLPACISEASFFTFSFNPNTKTFILQLRQSKLLINIFTFSLSAVLKDKFCSCYLAKTCSDKSYLFFAQQHNSLISVSSSNTIKDGALFSKRS